MPGKLLPPAIKAKVSVDSAIPILPVAVAAVNGYPAAIAPAVTLLSTAVTDIGFIQTQLMINVPPPIAPPSRIGINITGAILTQLSTILTAITAASTAAPLLPEPTATTTFTAANTTIGTTLPLVSTAITVGLITPQQI
jgi:hypothetical protein